MSNDSQQGIMFSVLEKFSCSLKADRHACFLSSFERGADILLPLKSFDCM